MTTTPDPDALPLSDDQLARMMSAAQRKRMISGDFRPDDIAKLRRWLNCSQSVFAERLDISIDTLQNWEQGRRTPDGPAKALLRLCARHPHLLTELATAG